MNSENKLTLAFSTCPNDTFIFEAMVKKRISVPEQGFRVKLADIGELNQMALQGDVDVVKISCALIPSIINDYVILTAGGALGYNCGPLLVAKNDNPKTRFDDPLVLIPGESTTAGFLLSRYFPQFTRRKSTLFSDIEDMVAQSNADLGLIIHESRFTYAQKGLREVADLGNLWHQETSLPVPLGCIAINRKLPLALMKEINDTIRNSLEFGFDHPDTPMDFIRSCAVSLEDSVILKHINLYVNEFSVYLGLSGKNAVRTLLSEKINGQTPIFVDELPE
jgi:1,4-dihydroxy-6-naphthoate synthase